MVTNFTALRESPLKIPCDKLHITSIFKPTVRATLYFRD